MGTRDPASNNEGGKSKPKLVFQAGIVACAYTCTYMNTHTHMHAHLTHVLTYKTDGQTDIVLKRRQKEEERKEASCFSETGA